MCPKSLSHVGLSATLWTVALQDPLFMDFSKQEYWSGFLCPPSGVLLNPGIEPKSPTLQADSLPAEPPGTEILEQDQKMFPETCDSEQYTLQEGICKRLD